MRAPVGQKRETESQKRTRVSLFWSKERAAIVDDVAIDETLFLGKHKMPGITFKGWFGF